MKQDLLQDFVCLQRALGKVVLAKTCGGVVVWMLLIRLMI